MATVLDGAALEPLAERDLSDRRVHQSHFTELEAREREAFGAGNRYPMPGQQTWDLKQAMLKLQPRFPLL